LGPTGSAWAQSAPPPDTPTGAALAAACATAFKSYDGGENETCTAGHPDPASGTLRLPLFGNQWALDPGHRARVDLMQVDAATFQPSKVPDTISFDDATLTLPLRQASGERLSATP
jgi:hypothetical protein